MVPPSCLYLRYLLFKYLFPIYLIAQEIVQRGEEWLSFAQFNLEILVPVFARKVVKTKKRA
jgi:hypothetical protein